MPPTSLETADSSSSSIQSSLLEGVRQRDGEAWRRFVDVFSPLIYDWCRGQGLQSADAADVMQEVFHSVSASVAQFRRDRTGDSFRGWLWAITRNKVCDHFRKRASQANAVGGTDAGRRLQHVPDVEPADSASDSRSEIARSPFRRALEAVQGDFSDTTWQAFIRVTVEGQTGAEVAADLKISVNAVRKAKARVLRRLREEFGDLLS